MTFSRMKTANMRNQKIDSVMEEVFEKMLKRSPDMKSLFFKKCFLSWLEGDQNKRTMTIK